MEEEAQRLINLARELSSNGGYSKAFDLYVMAFKKHPDFKEHFEAEFRVVLIQLNEVLYNAGKMEDIFTNFAKSIELFPGNCHLLNDIGKYLYKFGFYSEAMSHFQRAIRFDACYVNAEKNLNSIKNLLIERWHYRMLNDKIRNDAYFNAISQTLLRFKDSVLDIGTGTGLLAMFASECSAIAITGVDSSELMAWIAECVTQANGKHDIVIINKLSTTMNYREIGGKRSLVVTEMFDAGLFGEHVLQTLAHAWEYFTIPSTRIIPNQAEFFVVAAKSEHLHRKYQLGESIKDLLNIPELPVHILTYNESYDCEDVHLLKDLKYMSEPQSVLKVNFNDYRDIQDKLSRTEPYTVQLTAKEDGEINTVIGWFNLYLTPKVTLTTDPQAENRANAWQQAVFFDNIPTYVKQNQPVKKEFLINAGKLTMVANTNSDIMRISAETLRFLNDAEFMRMISGCIGMSCIYLGQMADISNLNIVDLSPFPMFGLMMLKRGAQSLICYAKTENDKKFIQSVFNANKISFTNVTVLIGEDWGHEVFKEEKYHAVFTNIFDLSGDIDVRLKQVALHLKGHHLLPGGLFMPAEIKLMIQLANSSWLDINNRVYDQNVRNYIVSEYMNLYEVTQNFCIDFENLEYTPVTDELSLGSINSQMKFETFEMPITNEGPANCILCWYHIQLMEDLDYISTKRDGCFMDGTLFLVKPDTPLTVGNTVRVLRCTEPEGAFKVMLDN